MLIAAPFALWSAFGVVLATDVTIDGTFFLGISALITTLVGVYTAVIATRAKKIADLTHTEVKTINDATLAQLADAAETRRIESKQSAGADVTPQELGHMRSVEEADYQLHKDKE